MNLRKLILIAGCLFMLTACAQKSTDVESDKNQEQTPELTKLRSDQSVDQDPANRAKQILSDHDTVKSVRAVNHDNKLLIGVQLNHNDRFNKDDIERTLRKKINKDTPNTKVSLSTDEKIHSEVKKLEEDLQKKQLSKKKLNKKIKDIHSLSQEQT